MKERSKKYSNSEVNCDRHMMNYYDTCIQAASTVEHLTRAGHVTGKDQVKSGQNQHGPGLHGACRWWEIQVLNNKDTNRYIIINYSK